MRTNVWCSLAIAAAAVMAPGWAMADEAEDTATANRIAANLKESGRLQGYRIGVSCQDGVALLEGDVTSNEQGVAALEIARQTEGVTQVVNRLMCPTPAEELAAEAAAAPLANRLKSTLQPQPAQLTSREVPQPTAGNEASSVAMPRQALPQQAMPHPYQQTSATMPAMPPVMPGAMPGAMPMGAPAAVAGAPVPGFVPGALPMNPARYDQPYMPNYSWPSYAAYPNYAAVTYPKQYSPTAWPYIGPFYPYPQVPLGWRKVTLEWDDGWWFLDFKD